MLLMIRGQGLHTESVMRQACSMSPYHPVSGGGGWGGGGRQGSAGHGDQLTVGICNKSYRENSKPTTV